MNYIWSDLGLSDNPPWWLNYGRFALLNILECFFFIFIIFVWPQPWPWRSAESQENFVILFETIGLLMCYWDSHRRRFDLSSPISDIKLSLFSVRVRACWLSSFDALNLRSSTLIFIFIFYNSSFSAAFSLGSICIFLIFMNGFLDYGEPILPFAAAAGPLLSDRFAIFVNI